MNKKITKKYLIIFCVAVCYQVFATYGNVANAEEPVIKLCPVLSKDKTYENDNDFKKIVAGKDGWIFRTGPDLKQDDFALSEWSVNSFKRLHDAFQKNGTEMAVVLLPTRGIVGHPYLLPPYDKNYDHAKAMSGYVGMLNAIKSAGIIVANTSDADKVNGFFLKRDNHWTAIGAKYMAQKMADAIKADRVYATLNKTAFETTAADPAETLSANDNFLEFIEEKCGEAPPNEYISKIFTTTSRADKNDQTALFGDASKPDVVLLGTSNSTDPQPSYANFAGFLKQHLGADLENKSVTGGSMRGAIGNYILMGEYEKAKPKLVIWELSAHYGFVQEDMFREIIPAVYGVCSDESAVVMASGKLGSRSTTIFEKLDDKILFSHDYYLALTLEDKEVREVIVNFTHMNNNKDKMEFQRSLRNFPTNNGLYFAELKDELEEPLQSVTVRTSGGKGGYKAKICKVPAH